MWLWIIVIGYIVYRMYKGYKLRLPQNLIAKNEELAEATVGFSRTTDYVAYGKEENEELNLIKSFYIRLKEKYKHNDKKLVEMSRDWLDYTRGLNSHSTGVYLWLEEGDKEQASERNKEIRENLIRVEEIENRFAELLGEKYKEELDGFRKAKEKASKEFFGELN